MHNEAFSFRGKRYLDEMANDARRMPELAHAMGAISMDNRSFSAVQKAAESPIYMQ